MLKLKFQNLKKFIETQSFVYILPIEAFQYDFRIV